MFVRLFLPVYQYVALIAACRCHGTLPQNRTSASGFRGCYLCSSVLNADFQKMIRCQPLNNNNSLIYITNQSWKLVTSYIGGVVGVCVMFYGIYFNQTGAFEFYGVVVGLSSGAFGCLSIRCPKCGLAWAWYAVTKQSLGEWVPWLLSVKQCPKCGFPSKEK